MSEEEVRSDEVNAVKQSGIMTPVAIETVAAEGDLLSVSFLDLSSSTPSDDADLKETVVVAETTVDDLGQQLSEKLDLSGKTQNETKTPNPYELIDSSSAVQSLIGSLMNLPTNPPSLYVDVEGVNLCRYGTVSIIQIYVLPHDRTYLLDIHTLGSKTFTTTGLNGGTLKFIFESSSIPKVFFDVRNDSDALHTHFGIKLAGIQDIQVMEFATRQFDARFVNGLKRCIERDISMPYTERRAWMACKDQGRKLFAPELGGSYEVFNVRPLSEELANYCVQDVKLLPALWKLYNSRMWYGVHARVQQAVEKRVRQSQAADYNPHGRERARGPW